MKIKLNLDYGGAKAGDVIECREQEALALINSGRGVNFEGQVEPKKEPQPTKKEEGKK
jgi:hypothetical protein